MDTGQKLGPRIESALSAQQRAVLETLNYTGLCQDTRLLEDGDLFVSLDRGDSRDEFYKIALEKGACGILSISGEAFGREVNKDTPQHSQEVCFIGDGTRSIPLIHIKEEKSVLSEMAAAFYPRRPAIGLAVTGTNGKTSVSFFVAQMLSLLGYPTLAIGTLGDFVFNPECVPWPRGDVSLTTPDVFSLHKTLQKAYDLGIKAYVMEASSHGLVQGRLGHLTFSAVGMTNVSPEHLDYHDSLKSYLAAKCLLFSEHLCEGGFGVVNQNSPYRDAFLEALGPKKSLTYGRNAGDICLKGVRSVEDGLEVSFCFHKEVYETKINLLGEYQGMNVLCAFSLVWGALKCHGILVREASMLETLPSLKPPKGRMEFVGQSSTGGLVYVDYAHTPEAFEVVLSQVGRHARGRVLVVFGCGGDRDAYKRPLMGAIASQYADLVYLTDDNPRTENPDSIRFQIRQGMDDSSCKIIELPDRARAIQEAIHSLQKGDILLLLGKGHETYQIIGTVSYDHSDQEIALEALGRSCQKESMSHG